MAETPSVMPQLHMPLQSGSDRILKAMRRSYRSERFLGILDRVRERMPDAAITTDIIVGFPGETDEDFEDTLRVVEQARFSSAFTFQYSIREGTPAATMPDQVPKARRAGAVRAARGSAGPHLAAKRTRSRSGRELEVLVSTGEGKKDAATHRLTGRAEDNRLVHFEVPAGSAVARGPAMSSRSSSPTRRRSTCSPTHRTAHRCASAAPAPATPGTGRRPSPARFPRRRRAGGPKAVALGLPTLRIGV